jgi:hypothetical protein
LTKPTGLVPVVAAITAALTTGGVVSIVNVCDATGDWALRALSVARDETVYDPSAGKLAAASPNDQLVVPLARLHTWLALENELPFQ